MSTIESTNTDKSLIVVAGVRGGVGKSLVAMAVIDWLISVEKAKVLVVDGDPDNADSFKPYKNIAPTPLPVNLDHREGWLVVADSCGEHPDAHVVVDTGARNLDSMLKFSAQIYTAVSAGLKRHVVVLWVVGGERNSVHLLRRYLDERTAETPLHVVCNQGAAEHPSFPLFDESDVPKRVAGLSGKIIVIPTLADRVTTLLYTHRHTLGALADGSAMIDSNDGSKDDSKKAPKRPVPFGTRVEVDRWRGLVWSELEKLDLMERKK